MGWSWPEDLQDRVLKKSVGTCESKPSRSWNTTNPNFVHFPGNPSKLTSHISVIFPKMGGISCPLKNPKWLWSGVFLFFLLKEWLKKRHPHFGASLVRKIHHWIFFFRIHLLTSKTMPCTWCMWLYPLGSFRKNLFCIDERIHSILGGNIFEHIQQIPYSQLIKQQINWPFCSFCWFVGLQDVWEPSQRLVKKWSSYSVVDHACLKGRANSSCKSNLTNTTSWRKAEGDFEPNICHPFSSMICNIGTLVWLCCWRIPCSRISSASIP